MYLYQITNLINNKVYIGQTNNITKRWSNHKCCNSPDMVIAKAIKKYGIENFKFEVLYRNIPIEEIDELERKTILEKNCRVPNGYNVAEGGSEHTDIHKYGADNSNAKLTEEDVLNIRQLHKDGVTNSELYKLYPQVTPSSIRNIINGKTWKNLL